MKIFHHTLVHDIEMIGLYMYQEYLQESLNTEIKTPGYAFTGPLSVF